MNLALDAQAGMAKPVTAMEIMGLCRWFKIRKHLDSLWMTEVGLAGGRVDLMVIDLRTFDVIGYEVKVSRRDFLSDDKWRSYVPFFNRFYFATAPGVIERDELPAGIGHVEARRESDGHLHLVQVCKASTLQPFFVKTLGENHLLSILLGYMRDFNWRHNNKAFFVQCRHCNNHVRLPDPRGLPFGGDFTGPDHEALKDVRANDVLTEAAA